MFINFMLLIYEEQLTSINNLVFKLWNKPNFPGTPTIPLSPGKPCTPCIPSSP